MADVNQLKELFNLWISGKCDPDQEAEFIRLMNLTDNKANAESLLQQLYNEPAAASLFNTDKRLALATRILHQFPGEKPAKPAPVHFLQSTWLRYAAAVVFIIATGAYFWFHNKEQQPFISDNKHLQEHILPGKEGATLTLADGSQLVLDSLGDGLVAAQNGAAVMMKNGQIAYAATGNTTGEMVYNTMSTPNGRQFQVTLPDGTQVWLNAASSIRYPTVFIGQERKVFVTGEAYFEVAKNAQQPFRVNINNRAEVDVLGTSFNINAYENETSISTTLIDGSLRVLAAVETLHATSPDATSPDVRFPPAKTLHAMSLQKPSALLHPGQQAVVQVAQQKPTAIRVVKDTDIDKVMAWKSGLFNFSGMRFDEIMRQVERWYDIQVVYENNVVPNKQLIGKMTRGVSLNDLLEHLKNIGVHFKLNARTLIITE